MQKNQKVLIVGGVAGGASCAARLRRQDEFAEIIVFEKGPYVSFANCGIPYYIGDVIQEEEELLIASPELFRDRYNIDTRVNETVIGIDRTNKAIEIRKENGETYHETYDYLVLSPGSQPIKPPISGIDIPGVFTVRTVPDGRHIRQWINEHSAKSAVVVGGGFIGLEMAENLTERGLEVTIVEFADQVMPPLDKEMTLPVLSTLEAKGLQVVLKDAVTAFEQNNNQIQVKTKEGKSFTVDLVIMAAGVLPDTQMLLDSGIDLGERGHITVDNNLRTNDRSIFAVGDAVQISNAITLQKTVLPLAGPANRQGRLVADVIAGKGRFFRGVQGTSVCGVFDITIASTGLNEKYLSNSGTDYGVVYAHPNDHVGYYPGATPIFLKLLFDKASGRVLGAQSVGQKGIERRIDVIAMAIQMGATVFDLEESELCYAPQYGAAKDPINIVGMIAANVMRGDLHIIHWQDMHKDNGIVLDVRDPDETEGCIFPADKKIPLNDLRSRLDELPKNQPINVSCAVGARAYNAVRLLMQHGFNASLLSGGASAWFCINGKYPDAS